MTLSAAQHSLYSVEYWYSQ